jgi:hypothetical protein
LPLIAVDTVVGLESDIALLTVGPDGMDNLGVGMKSGACSWVNAHVIIGVFVQLVELSVDPINTMGLSIQVQRVCLLPVTTMAVLITGSDIASVT